MNRDAEIKKKIKEDNTGMAGSLCYHELFGDIHGAAVSLYCKFGI